MKVIDIANEIYLELGSPTSTSIPAISFWLRAKVGDINNLLFEQFIINDSFEIVDSCSQGEISLEATSIIKLMYKIYDWELQIRNNLNALATDSLLQVQDNFGGASFTRVNRNEISKTIASLKKDEVENFNKLVNAYRIRKSTPKQVAGDDTVPEYLQPYVTYVRGI